ICIRVGSVGTLCGRQQRTPDWHQSRSAASLPEVEKDVWRTDHIRGRSVITFKNRVWVRRLAGRERPLCNRRVSRLHWLRSIEASARGSISAHILDRTGRCLRGIGSCDRYLPKNGKRTPSEDDPSGVGTKKR